MGFRILSGDDNGLVKIWRSQEEEPQVFGRQAPNQGIQKMCWTSDIEESLSLVRDSGELELWKLSAGQSVMESSVNLGESSESSASQVCLEYLPNDTLLAVNTDGQCAFLRHWQASEEVSVDLCSIQGPVSHAVVHESACQLVAGGIQNNLKLYDLSQGEPTEVWAAAKLPRNFLNLEQKNLLTCVTFLPLFPEAAAVGTQDGFLRIYDLRAPSKLPMINMPPTSKVPCPYTGDETDIAQPISVIAADSQYRLATANAYGTLVGFDLRKLEDNQAKLTATLRKTKSHTKEALVAMGDARNYSGIQSTITDLKYHPIQNYLGASALSRFVYAFEADKREGVQSFYCKQKLRCLLWSKEA